MEPAARPVFDRLAALNHRAARVVEYRIFAGFRVLVTAEMCSVSYGSRGPWQALTDSWIARYRLADAEPDVARLVTGSIPQLPRIARICLQTPLSVLGNRALTAWIDPSEVSPPVLSKLERASRRRRQAAKAAPDRTEPLTEAIR